MLGVVTVGGSEKERDFEGVLFGDEGSGGGRLAVMVSTVVVSIVLSFL